MKKIIALLLLAFVLIACNSHNNQTNSEKPQTFEPTITSTKQKAYYINPIADDEGNMVIPLNADCAIITTDETKADYMKETFENTIVYYHKLLDPSHSFKGINNIKTINDNYGKGPVKVDSELIEIIDSAITLSELTEGYFNPTIGTLSDVWKDLFNAEHINNDPSPDEVAKALTASIDYQKLRDYIVLDKENSTVSFNKLEDNDLNVKIDLGAYSKGYVMDKAYNELLKYKDGFLISAGGSSIITYVEPTQEKLHWIIGVKNPNNGASAFQLKITNAAISTSGDEQQFFINELGIRRHHILNPYTGYPENNYRSVTLLAQNNAGALDGLSTAIYSADDIDKLVNDVAEANNLKIDKALIIEDNDLNLLLSYDEDLAPLIYEIDSSQVIDASEGN